MKRLYKVKISTDIMIFADNELEASNVAKSIASNEINNGCDTVVESANDSSDIPDDWMNIIPYSSTATDKTCSQILKEIIRHDAEEIGKIVVENNSKIAYNKPSIDVNKQKEPKPSKELEWKETGNKQTQPPLRFI